LIARLHWWRTTGGYVHSLNSSASRNCEVETSARNTFVPEQRPANMLSGANYRFVARVFPGRV